MPPSPTLETLIETVRADALTNDPLGELSQAATTVNELEAVGDALLDYFVHRCRREGRSWSEISAVLGVSKQAAHKRFSRPFRTGAPPFERFTERARIVLGDAADQARRLGHQVVGSEHLLLALFEPVDALSSKILLSLGSSYDDVKDRLTRKLAALRH